MLQRIQSLYMLIAVLVSATFYYVMPADFYSFYEIYYWTMVALTLILFGNIFMYFNRKLQLTVNNLIIFAMLLLVVLRIYEAVTSGEAPFSKKDVIWLLPVLSIVFVKLANKYIKRDESLVKSVDRIR